MSAVLAGTTLAATEITFHVRHDVFWHDGEPTTARDVAFTYLRATDPRTVFPNAAYFANYVPGEEGVDVVDDYTVKIRLRPHADYMDPWRTLAILPEHLPSDKIALVQRRKRPTERQATTLTEAFPAIPDDVVSTPQPNTIVETIDLRAGMKERERDLVRDALDRAGGNQTRAAKLLGISRRTLIARIEEFGLPRPRKRVATDTETPGSS